MTGQLISDEERSLLVSARKWDDLEREHAKDHPRARHKRNGLSAHSRCSIMDRLVERGLGEYIGTGFYITDAGRAALEVGE